MLLIFGIRVYFWTIGQGTFHCQRCGGDRPYKLKAGRRFIHLFFIPVIPLGKVGEYVQCTQCRARYRPDVLALPTMAQMQAALPAGMQAAAITMLRAGDPAGIAARRRAVEAIRGAGIADFDEARLDADLGPASALDPQVAVPSRLSALSTQLAPQAREWFLAEIVRIGLADGALSDSERQAAHDVAGYLGMTQAQAVGVITLTEEGASAG
jgi:tellurite resistance protein